MKAYGTQALVKTEKEFSELFVESCQCPAKQKDFVIALGAHYWLDLTGHLNRYFSNEDREAISILAAQKLSENFSTATPEEAWTAVVRDFTQNSYWQFSSVANKPAVKKTEEQKIFWQLFKYAWAFFQSMVILKIAVYYFGLESAENPDQVSKLWVWFFFALSAGSLGFFAYRNRNDNG